MVHVEDLHEAVVLHSSFSRTSSHHTLSSLRGSAFLALDRVRVQQHCRMWRHLVQCATSCPEDIFVHECR
eukprot:scaffold6549_cov71-Phaeocystis_antarctica.AAC.1